jgi:hypothetical protein
MTNAQGTGVIHTSHGNTPAAWTTVGIILIGSVVAGIAVVLGDWWVFLIGAVGLPVVGLIVGKIMASMGLGNTPLHKHSQVQVSSTACELREADDDVSER